MVGTVGPAVVRVFGSRPSIPSRVRVQGLRWRRAPRRRDLDLSDPQLHPLPRWPVAVRLAGRRAGMAVAALHPAGGTGPRQRRPAALLPSGGGVSRMTRRDRRPVAKAALIGAAA